MSDVAAWLATPEGDQWSRRQHSREPLTYHDLIEFKDEQDCEQIADHTWVCAGWMLDLMREMDGWADVEWNPDLSP